MSNPNLIHNSPFEYDEVRLFVRHSDGSSLVIPEQSNDIEQLSFRIQIPFGKSTEKRVEAINEAMHSDEDRDMGFVALQRFLAGAEGVERRESGLTTYAYGYLGQIHIGKPTGEGTGRQVLSLHEAHDAMNTSPLIDSIDRRLALKAFQTIEMSGSLAS